jgi:hypothetical protein
MIGRASIIALAIDLSEANSNQRQRELLWSALGKTAGLDEDLVEMELARPLRRKVQVPDLFAEPDLSPPRDLFGD